MQLYSFTGVEDYYISISKSTSYVFNSMKTTIKFYPIKKSF